MVSKRIIIRIATALCLLAAPPAGADATLFVQGSDGLKSTIQLRDGMGRMSAAGVDEYLIYDSGSGTITFVEPAQQQYTQVRQAELESGLQAAAGLQQAVAPYMADMLAGLSPEQRRMIQQRLGGLPGAPAAGHRPGQDERIETVSRGTHIIAGLRCEASGIVKNGRPSAEVCMLTTANGKLSRQDFDTLQSLVSFSRGMAATAGSLLGDLAKQLEFLAVEIEGVPIAVRDLDHGKRYQVTAVSDAALPGTLFDGYGDYRRREMPVLLR